jgi:site-specific recombinase XerD
MIQKHTFSLFSYLRKSKTNSEGLVPVHLRITLDGVRTEISTKTFVDPQKWDSKRGKVKGTSEEARRLNACIESYEHRAREIYIRLLERGRIFTVQEIKNELTGMVHKGRKLLATLKLHVQDMVAKIGRGYAPGTVKNWKVTEGHLETFLKEHYHRSDISFKELEESFLSDFDAFARRKWNCKTNAVLKHLQRIGKVVKKAVIKGWLEKNPFSSYEAKWDKTHRTFLSAEELKRLEEKTFSAERLERVRDLFLFSCYTGLAYIDIEALTPNNLVVGIDGKKWIYTFRTKTGNKSNVPLLPPALSILEKYKDHPACTTKGKLLPVITNIKTNEYLKEIADVCGIKKNLTFHMARHTFATTVTLTNGVPMETVSNLLGHTKITTTQIYAKVLENKVSQDMQQLEKKLKRNKK